jgi:hypothetical protein
MFRYYIFDPFEGKPVGTNSSTVAEHYAMCEDYFVIDTEQNLWLMSLGVMADIEETT